MKRVFLWMLLLALLIGCTNNATDSVEEITVTESDESEKIFVGVMSEYSPYIVSLEGGVIGPYIDIISKALDNLGYEYEIVPLPWSRLLNAVELGDVDIALPLYDKQERRSILFYGEEPIGFSQVIFIGREDTDIVYEGDFSSLQDLHIGVVQDYFYSEGFDDGLSSGMIKAEEAVSTDKNIEKLLQGRVDIILEDIAVVKNYMDVNNREESLKYFDYPISSDYNHIVFTKTKDLIDLRRGLDLEFRSLKENGEMYEIFEVYNMGYYADLFKTLEEDSPPPDKFIKDDSNPLKIGVLKGTKPYVYYENNQLTGFAIDMMTEALNRIGVSFEYVELPFSRMLEELKSGSLDIGMDLYLKPERESFVAYPELPFAGLPTVLFKKAETEFLFSGDLNELAPYTIGYVRDYYLGPLDEYKEHENFEFVITDSPEQNMENLINDRVDIIIDIQSTGESLIDELNLSGFIESVEPAIHYDYSYAVFSKANNLEKLVSEYNYVIGTMFNDGTIKKISEKYGLPYMEFKD